MLVLLGDQPAGRSGGHLTPLVAAFRETGAPIVMPTYGGVAGQPRPARPRALPGESLAVTGDQGAREVVRAHRAEMHLVPFPDRRPPRDVDTEEDYRALLAAWQAGS